MNATYSHELLIAALKRLLCDIQAADSEMHRHLRVAREAGHHAILVATGERMVVRDYRTVWEKADATDQ